MVRPTSGEQVSLRVLAAPDLGHVQAGPAQLEQVVLNLALNVSRRDAGGTLTIETSNTEVSSDYVASHLSITPGLHVRLVVSDTGVGMDPATRTHMFEPFFTTKAFGEGTGLGRVAARAAAGGTGLQSPVRGAAVGTTDVQPPRRRRLACRPGRRVPVGQDCGRDPGHGGLQAATTAGSGPWERPLTRRSPGVRGVRR